MNKNHIFLQDGSQCKKPDYVGPFNAFQLKQGVNTRDEHVSKAAIRQESTSPLTSDEGNSSDGPTDINPFTGREDHQALNEVCLRRTVFTKKQLEAMEDRFLRQSFLSREERIEFGDEINLSERQIMIWFQNRRYVIPNMNQTAWLLVYYSLHCE